MSLEITECRNVSHAASTDVDGISFGSAASMPPYIPRQRDRREAVSELLASLARAIDRRLDVSLMRGAWYGHSWLQHTWDLLALALIFTVCTALAVRVFRWE